MAATTVLDRPLLQRAILGLIVLNAIVLGLEQVPALVAWRDLLHLVDRICLAVFCVELALKAVLLRRAFARDPWNWFDTAVVAIALVPAVGPLAVLRALRVLRVLRLVTAVPAMRLVVGALLRSLPGMGAILAVLGLILYVFAVMGTGLFGAADGEHFGSLARSAFTLFQVMTLEGWADIARGLMAVAPWAWAFFLAFILMGTFVVLNLFIAVIGNSMQDVRGEQAAPAPAAPAADDVATELRRLREEVAALRAALPPPAARSAAG